MRKLNLISILVSEIHIYTILHTGIFHIRKHNEKQYNDWGLVRLCGGGWQLNLVNEVLSCAAVLRLGSCILLVNLNLVGADVTHKCSCTS